MWFSCFLIQTQSSNIQPFIFPQKQIDETNAQQNSILDILSSAQSSLTQANSMLGLLQKSKEVLLTCLG